MSYKALPGFRDFYPEQLAERAYVFSTWRRVISRYGFSEYDGPPLESQDLYTAKSGDEIVGQLYNFLDKGQRAVSLRPEMTPTFARMVSTRVQSLRKPIRWFSIPQLFRYERQQKGRLREHFQLNVDVVGEGDSMADAEVISVAIEIMQEFGLTSSDIRARVSDRQLLNGLLDHLQIDKDLWPRVYSVLDKLEKVSADESVARLYEVSFPASSVEAILALRDMSFEEFFARYGDAPSVAVHAQRFAEFLKCCKAQGIEDWIQFDLTIVRGLAYYTGLVFELFDAIGEHRAICGGGRYDNLLSVLGGVDLPALGFGMGDVVLSDLLRERGLMKSMHSATNRFHVVAGDGVSAENVIRIVSRLRKYLPSSSGSSVHLNSSSITYGLNRAAIEERRTGRQVEEGRAFGANFFIHVTEPDPTSTFKLPSIAVADASFKRFERLETIHNFYLLNSSAAESEIKEAAQIVDNLAGRLRTEIS